MSSRKQRFIPGIYNYCDYWCERCAFTRRCRNFAMGRALDRQVRGEPPIQDAANAEFWNDLAEELRETALFRSHDFGTDFFSEDADEPDPAWEAREAARREAVERHALCRHAREYMRQVAAWLKSAEADLKAYARSLAESDPPPFAPDDLEEEARGVGELMEVVSWYHTLIPTKISRAVGGLLEREEAGSPAANILRESRRADANGSGKVALAAIERSIAAWLRLREILPAQESAILNLLALLDRLRRGLRAALPGAESFRRPGFDDEPERD